MKSDLKKSDLGYWLQRFFREHLSQQRNVSSATIEAYRDTFRLLLQFLRGRYRRTPSALSMDTLTVDAVIKFLEHLEGKRHNAISTRNARLAALRSFVRYLEDWLGPELTPATRHILSIPFKRYPKPMIGYLLREEIDALLAATDDTWTGSRDYLLFLLLYNTGARISEILKLQVRDVLDSGGRLVQLQGKGRKRRTLPLWPKTQRCLRQWIRQNQLAPEAPLLPNRFGHVLTRSGAAKQLQELIDRTKAKCPSLQKRRISLHQIRHATAMHMLEAGVPAEVIALWLGHESPNTTHGYVEASLAMKKRALGALQSPQAKGHKPRLDDALLRFLDTL
jgi:integrase/recombinase XerD